MNSIFPKTGFFPKTGPALTTALPLRPGGRAAR